MEQRAAAAGAIAATSTIKSSQHSLGGSKGPHAKECQDLMYNIADNEYHLANWQQRQQQQNCIIEGSGFVTSQPPPYGGHLGRSAVRYPAPEHLYESPDFDRKDFVPGQSGPVCMPDMGRMAYEGTHQHDAQYA